MSEYVPVKEFRERGYLQEVNRLFFHPLGMALAVEQGDDGEWRFVGVLDARDDPEGFMFEDGCDPVMAVQPAEAAA
jgi:hypothetical protein